MENSHKKLEFPLLFPEEQEKSLLRQPIAPRKEVLSYPPSSFAQWRIWFLDQLSKNNSYTLLISFRIQGELHWIALLRALNELIRRHEALRTNLVMVEEQLIQVIAPKVLSSFNIIDLHILSDSLRKKEILRIANEEAQRTFDLAHDMLLRATLLRLANDEHLLLLNAHHTVIDGWSSRIFTRELSTLYDAFIEERSSPLPELPIQYADFALWQGQWLQSKEFARQLDYWKFQLEKAPYRIELPKDRSYLSTKTFKGATQTMFLSKDLSEALKIFSLHKRVILFITLLTALKILLFKWTSQTDIVVGTVVAGRSRPETKELIGCFINFLALRSRLSEDQVGLELLDQVKTTFTDAFKYQDCPFEKIVQAIQPGREANQNPLYNVALLLQNYGGTAPALRSGAIFPYTLTLDKQSSLLDLRFVVYETLQGIKISCEYNTDIFEPATIEHLNDSYSQILDQFVHNPTLKLTSYSVSQGLEAQMMRAQANKFSLNLAITATFTAEPLQEVLDFWMQEFVIPTSIEIAPYNQVFQQLLGQNSVLSRNIQGVNIILVRFEDWLRYNNGDIELISFHEETIKKLKNNVDDLVQTLSIVTQHTSTPHIIVICPYSPQFRSNAALEVIFQRIEDQFIANLENIPGVNVISSLNIMATYPVTSYYDSYTDRLGHVPFTPLFFTALGTIITRKIYALLRNPYKVLVLDCDNTLWKGLCGEDGSLGIEIDEASKSLQEFIVAQYNVGMLICLCSKNNEENVIDVFEKHSEMPLKRDHILSWRVNWKPKSKNIYELAEELHLSLDSFIFIDDDPIECAEVQTFCPDVLTIQLPHDRSNLSTFLSHLWVFDHVKVTEEDGRRTGLYRQEIQRQSLQKATLSLEDFLAKLDLCVQVTTISESQLARSAQLTQRTNQFNCTTIRRSESEIQYLCQEKNFKCFIVEAHDRFGQYGLVGVMIFLVEASNIIVDTFLLSCRALGKGIEHRMLADLGRFALTHGIRGVTIPYRPTTKNKVALEFLERVHFAHKEVCNDGWNFHFTAESASKLTYSPHEKEAILTESLQQKEAKMLPCNAPRIVITSEQICSIATKFHEAEQILQRVSSRRLSARKSETAFEVASTPTEEILAGIWTQLLRLDHIGRYDDFFILGGNSLLATQMISRVYTTLQVEISLQAVFQATTLIELARQIEEERLPASYLPILPQSRASNFLPLSFAQQRMWLLDQLEPNNASYIISIDFRIQGTLRVAALEQSLNEIVHRHEALRTSFPLIEGQPGQVIHSEVSLHLPLVDLSILPATTRETEIARLAIQEKLRPFNLAQGPLLHTTLLQLDLQEHILLVTIHHIVADGWSMGVFRRELSALYAAFSQGMPTPLPTLPIQYADFAIWQRQWLQGRILQEQLDYWKAQLAGVSPVLHLPTDHSRPAIQTFRGATQPLLLSKKLSDALTALSQQEGVTLFMMLLAAFQTLLLRYSGQEDIIVGSPIANRKRIETEVLIGFFANTLALRTDLSGNPSFRDLLKRVRQVAIGAYAHQDLPFEKLIEELHLERDLSRNPLFQTTFVLLNVPTSALELTNLHLRSLHVPGRTAKFDLTLTMWDTSNGLAGTLEYNIDLFEDLTINLMLNHLQTLLEGIVANPQQRLADLPLLSETERRQLLVDWNQTQAIYTENLCLHQLFEAQVERTPDAIALVFEEQCLTYEELNRRADHLAGYLRRRGVGPEVLVGVCLNRSATLVVALLAILKAGGAYVPLDPTYPVERLSFMIEDSRLSVVITQTALANTLPHSTFVTFCLDTVWPAYSSESRILPKRRAIRENLAYILYTSGSTGKPNGVMVTHTALTNLLTAIGKEIALISQDTFLATTTLSFDIAALEIYLPLIKGACVVIVPHNVASDGYRLLNTLSQSNVTVAQATPATWRLLLNAGWQGKENLRILCGGEALTQNLAIQLWQRSAALWNVYGPTETTIWSTSCQLSLQNQKVSLGKPIANTQIYILDKYLNPVPIGVPGELYIGGSGVARGYFNNAVLTAERFIPDMFCSQPGKRLYRTGDLVKRRSDDILEFLGRTDHQIKIRGFRIELEEIENVLNRHDDIAQSVVVMQAYQSNDIQLVGYVVKKTGATVTNKQIRDFLHERLPYYMVPAIIVSLDTLPLTPNGKIDRRALPLPDRSLTIEAIPYIAPESELERMIAEIWKDVLGVTQVGVNDNFFDLGGHSLLTPIILNKLKNLVELPLSIVDLFTYPTIKSLSNHLSKISFFTQISDEYTNQSETHISNVSKQRSIRRAIRTLIEEMGE